MKTDYAHYVHAVADLETLALDERAVVLSIGIVAVKKIEVLGEWNYHPVGDFYLNLTGTLFEQILAGRTISESTVEFWNDPKQRDALIHLMSENGPRRISDAEKELKEWLKAVAPDKNKLMLWGNGSGFDCNKVESLFPGLGIPFWLHRDLRSNLDTTDVSVDRSDGIFHHALSDAKNQAKALTKSFHRMDQLRAAFEATGGVFDEWIG